ncbi:MAG: hypothetical protein M3N57_09175 [Actinomycetota bacterium]|nr:hypothetical protein [Actinomycetota bacterium]
MQTLRRDLTSEQQERQKGLRDEIREQAHKELPLEAIGVFLFALSAVLSTIPHELATGLRWLRPS